MKNRTLLLLAGALASQPAFAHHELSLLAASPAALLVLASVGWWLRARFQHRDGNRR